MNARQLGRWTTTGLLAAALSTALTIGPVGTAPAIADPTTVSTDAQGVAGAPGLSGSDRIAAVAAEDARRWARAEHLGQELAAQTVLEQSARVRLGQATAVYATLSAQVEQRRAVLDRWARDNYLRESAMPPATAPFDDARTLGRPWLKAPTDPELPALERRLAAARITFQNTQTVQQQAAAVVTATRARLDGVTAALATFRRQHQALLAAGSVAADRSRWATGSTLLSGADAAGLGAAPDALRAVRFALAQQGKPYVWAEEGPASYDCSGLVMAAYTEAGIALPRTARPQFRATTPVSISGLLPGDLLFFATDRSDWRTIHHVGIYLGGGRMIHAPTTGDVVRVAPVWWEEFFGATRAVGAVPASARPATNTGRDTPPASRPAPPRGPHPAPGRPPRRPVASATPTPRTSPSSTPPAVSSPTPSSSVSPNAPAASVVPPNSKAPSSTDPTSAPPRTSPAVPPGGSLPPAPSGSWKGPGMNNPGTAHLGGTSVTQADGGNTP